MKNQPTKLKLLAGVGLLGAVVVMGPTRWVFADSDTSDPDSFHGQRHHMKCGKAFKLGVCVGQELFEEGITLKASEYNRPSTIDRETLRSVKKAVKTCREKFRGEEPSRGQGESNPSEEENI